MKAKRGKAWACSACGMVYPSNRAGKAIAEACCMCCECKVNRSLYIRSHGTRCRDCLAERELAAALDNMEHAKARLTKAQRGTH